MKSPCPESRPCSLGRRRLAALLLAALPGGCASPDPPAQSGPAMPNPIELAPHEWDHGPPWSPYDTPWVLAPATLGPWPGVVGMGAGVVIGRGWWWRGQPGHGGWGGAWRGHRRRGRR